MKIVDTIFDSPYSFSSSEWFLIYVSVCLILCAFMGIIAIFVSRIRKSTKEKREARLKVQFQKILNALIINQGVSDSPTSVLTYRIDELKKTIGDSNFATQLLIDEIIRTKKNLTGSAVILLTEIYYLLGLDVVSRNKLSSIRWYEQAKGIREVSEMKDHQSLPAIRKFIDSPNMTLRDESILAIMRLDQRNPFGFLNGFEGELNVWMLVNIFQHLSTLPVDQVPDFQKWFEHENESIVYFALSVARQRRQRSAIEGVIKLLKHDNVNIAKLAIEALGELEAFEATDDLLFMTDRSWADSELSNALMVTLGKIGSGQNVVMTLQKFATHPDYLVRFNALKSLQILDKHNQILNNAQKILEHINEPLLQ
jgi:hypothetical protein